MAALLCTTAQAASESHDGPKFSAYVTRGDLTLPLYKVDRLRKNDKLVVNPDADTVGKEDWLLILARISPSGSKIAFKEFELGRDTRADLTISSDDDVPVIVLAPALRTLFGLSSSVHQSAGLITEAITTDPQRFVDLQKIDLISQTIAALVEGLDAVVQDKKSDQAIDAAKHIAAKYGLQSVSTDCFKGGVVNTQCVAADIVANASLNVPTADELGALTGTKSAGSLPGQLFDSIKTFTAASDYFTSKYRDQYDFTPSFARRISGTSPDSMQLYSIGRFKNGSVKTAYVYVPAWFKARMPALSVDQNPVPCLGGGSFKLDVTGRLPVTNYWHDWHLDLSDAAGNKVAAPMGSVTVQPENGRVLYGAADPADYAAVQGQLLKARLTGYFGFEPVRLDAFDLALPGLDSVDGAVQGLDGLVTEESVKLGIKPPQAACVQAMALQINGKTVQKSRPEQRGQLDLNLAGIAPGPATLVISQIGLPDKSLAVRILHPRAGVKRIDYFDSDTHVSVSGEGLDRIESVQLGAVVCSRGDAQPALSDSSSLQLTCSGGPMSRSSLPDTAVVVHKDHDPGDLSVRLGKHGPRPNFRIAAREAHAFFVQLSEKAAQWGLSANDAISTDDSGHGFLLSSVANYALQAGSYQLQIRFADDPVTEKSPITVPLLADRAHNELRTRSPVNFGHVQFPGIVNPMYFRVVHVESGVAGDWQDLQHAVVTLPELTSSSCTKGRAGWMIHGKHLDLIDGVSAKGGADALQPINIERCDDGECFRVADPGPGHRVGVKVHWVDQTLFQVRLPDPSNSAPACEP